jgi:iron complex outermembrane receptor protein
MKALLSGGTAVAALIASSAALAQAAPQAAGAEAGGIEEIVVTAQRRTERLENVPMAVAALSADALERAQVVNVHELGRLTPGVQIGFAGVSTQPAIRGITSLTNGSGNENNVAIYVDGFYVSDNLTINQDLANLQGIQVLKGPQGTLYGRNATGGAILVRTLDPSEELTGKLEGSYGKFSERKLNGYISAPLSDKVGFIVAGAYRKNDGWIKKSVPGNPNRFQGYANPQNQRAFRAKLKAELSDTLTATAAYNYSFTSDTSGNLFTNFQFVPAFVTAGGNNACCFGKASGNGKNIAAGKTNQVTLTVEWETGIGTLTSRTGYDKRTIQNDFDFDGSYNQITFSEGSPRFRAFQQSLDYVITGIDNVDLVVGAFYFDEKTKLENTSFSFPGGIRARVSTSFRDLRTKAYAAYADLTYKLTDKLAVGIGGRYSRDKKAQGFRNDNVNPALNILAPNTSFSSSKFTPRATIRYEVADRSNIYATVSRGFRAASYNSAASSTASAILPIKAETITSYEVGFKTAQRFFRAEVAGFYYDYKNLNTSLTVTNPLNPFAPTLIVGNAPKAKVKGIEAQVVAMPFERFNITLGAAYIHARYGSFPNAIGNGFNAVTGFNLTSQVQDWTGQQMARAPDFTANLAVDYTVPVADGELRLSGNVKYTDSYVVNNPSLWNRSSLACPATATTAAGTFGGACQQVPANLLNKQRYRQGSFTLVDGEITWFAPDQRYWVGVYGKNLTNKSYKLTFNGNVFGDYATKAPPISYGVKVGYKF